PFVFGGDRRLISRGGFRGLFGFCDGITAGGLGAFLRPAGDCQTQGSNERNKPSILHIEKNALSEPSGFDPNPVFSDIPQISSWRGAVSNLCSRRSAAPESAIAIFCRAAKDNQLPFRRD